MDHACTATHSIASQLIYTTALHYTSNYALCACLQKLALYILNMTMYTCSRQYAMYVKFNDNSCICMCERIHVCVSEFTIAIAVSQRIYYLLTGWIASY